MVKRLTKHGNSLALVIDSFRNLAPLRLIPPAVVEEAEDLARRGRHPGLRDRTGNGDGSRQGPWHSRCGSILHRRRPPVAHRLRSRQPTADTVIGN